MNEKELTSVRDRTRIPDWDLWLSGLCTGIPVIDPGFNPGQKSVLSHFPSLFWPVLHEHITIYLRPGQLRALMRAQ